MHENRSPYVVYAFEFANFIAQPQVGTWPCGMLDLVKSCTTWQNRNRARFSKIEIVHDIAKPKSWTMSPFVASRNGARFEVVHDLAKSCTILQNRDRARFGEIVHDLADRNRARLGLMRFLISNVFRFIFKNVCNFPQESTPPCSEIRLRGEIHFCLHFQRDFDENVRNSPERYKDTR